MLATAPLVELPHRGFLDCRECPSLDQRMAEAHDRLALLIDEMNSSGLLLDPAVLRRLRSCATEALGVALAYRRRVGPCGYGCRFPPALPRHREPCWPSSGTRAGTPTKVRWHGRARGR
jgi:hypothetical protein